MIIVLTTAPDSTVAEDLARRLIASKLAACVQILPPIKSFYFWEGEITTESEHLILIKTLEENYDALEKSIRENHPYDVPEIIAVAAEKVSESYLNWVGKYVRSGNER